MAVEEDNLLGQFKSVFDFLIFDLRFRLREGREHKAEDFPPGGRDSGRTAVPAVPSQCLLGFCEVRGPYRGAYRRTGRPKSVERGERGSVERLPLTQSAGSGFKLQIGATKCN